VTAAPRRHLAARLMRVAVALLPQDRAAWGRAMRAELDCLEQDSEALTWALGCVLAGARERVSAMLPGNLKISRWVLCAEMLLCFVPPTLAWLDMLAGTSGVIRLSPAVIERYFLNSPADTLLLISMLTGSILGILAPLSLILALRVIVLGRPLRIRWLRSAIVAGPALAGLFGLVCQVAFNGVASLGWQADNAFDVWSGFLLLCALPIFGAVHLLRLSPLQPHARLAAST